MANFYAVLIMIDLAFFSADVFMITRVIVARVRRLANRRRTRRWVRAQALARPTPATDRASATPQTATGAATCHEPAAPVALPNGRRLIKL